LSLLPDVQELEELLEVAMPEVVLTVLPLREEQLLQLRE